VAAVPTAAITTTAAISLPAASVL